MRLPVNDRGDGGMRLPRYTLVLHTNMDEVPHNGDTMGTDGLERSSNVWKNKEVTE